MRVAPYNVTTPQYDLKLAEYTARPQEVEIVVANVVVGHIAVAPISPASPPAVADNEDLILNASGDSRTSYSKIFKGRT